MGNINTMTTTTLDSFVLKKCHNCGSCTSNQYYNLNTSPMTLQPAKICTANYSCKILCKQCIKKDAHKKICHDLGSTATPILEKIIA